MLTRSLHSCAIAALALFTGAQAAESARSISETGTRAATPTALVAPARSAAGAAPVTVEVNYIARDLNAARAAPSAGPPITVEVSYIARDVSAPVTRQPAAGTPITVENNFIARPVRR